MKKSKFYRKSVYVTAFVLSFVFVFGLDVNISDAATGYYYESSPFARAIDINDKIIGGSIKPFETSFKGGQSVALGDINGDGDDEVVIGSGYGKKAQVKVYDMGANLLGKFYPTFYTEGGVNLAVGDLNNDGKDEIVVSKVFGNSRNRNGNTIEVWGITSENFVLKSSFDPFYGKNFRGISVASGDINGDGVDEIIAAPSTSGVARVGVFKMGGYMRGSFLAMDTKNWGSGVNLSVGDLNNDGKDDIVVTSSSRYQVRDCSGKVTSSTGLVKVFYQSGNKFYNAHEFYPLGKSYEGVMKTTVADIDGDSVGEIVISNNNPRYKPSLMAFTRYGKNLNKYMRIENYYYRGGLNIASGELDYTAGKEIMVVPDIRNSSSFSMATPACVE